MSLHHTRSMWQPQPFEYISKINQKLIFSQKFSQIHEKTLEKILESRMGELFHLKGKINNEFFNQHTCEFCQFISKTYILVYNLFNDLDVKLMLVLSDI